MNTPRFSKRIFATRVVRPGKRYLLMRWTGLACGVAFGFVLSVIASAQQSTSPHLDPTYGVQRVADPNVAIGGCAQCHDQHSLETGESPYPSALFTENSNNLCYTPGAAGPCHQLAASNYPAVESHRIPEGFPDAGYFEYNSGGQKIWGTENRSRWPGQAAYENPGMVAGLHYFSPHRNDPDMPQIDPSGAGSCLNCHNVHGSESAFDMLVEPYGGIGGFDEPTYPTRYNACLVCHSTYGPPGMEIVNKAIADYYDTSINGEQSGHQIRMNPQVALTWPAHIQIGDKLPCYDCHGAHGSVGYNNEGPNAFLISDERPGWANLTGTRTDAEQNRRFCLGCHIPSDGMPGSQVVEGIVMNTISDRGANHTSMGTKACFDCHGRDYSSPTSNNVHNPSPAPRGADDSPLWPEE